MLPHHVDPVVGVAQSIHMLHLDRRMTYYLDQLFVGPDIGLERSDIEVANHNHAVVLLVVMTKKPTCQLSQIGQLLSKFGVCRDVRNIAAGRDIKIMKRYRRPVSGGTGDPHRKMT